MNNPQHRCCGTLSALSACGGDRARDAAGAGGGGPGGQDEPVLGTPGYVWERWRTPVGGWVEIVGERPPPRTSRHRVSIGVLWQCSQCPQIASQRHRLPTTRELAVEHLVHHVRELTAGSAPSKARPTMAPGGAPEVLRLPYGWAARHGAHQPAPAQPASDRPLPPPG